jgi:hypothetical protein
VHIWEEEGSFLKSAATTEQASAPAAEVATSLEERKEKLKAALAAAVDLAL